MKRLTLGDVCKKASSNIAQKDLQDKIGAYPIYGASGLIKQVDFYQQDKEYIAVVKDGAGIGRTMLLPAYSSVIGTMQYLLPKEGIPIDIKYLFYAVEHMNLAKYFSGATIPHIYFKDYQKEPINIPDIDTQRKISRIFDKIDALITSRKEQRTKLDQIVKSRFMEMFGDLADPACDWPQSKLTEVCADPDDIKCGPFGTQLNKAEYRHEGVALWEIPQINAQFRVEPTHYLDFDKAAELDAYSIIPGDIAMSRKGNVGQCAVFPCDYMPGIIHSDVLRIRVDSGKMVPIFMMYQLHYSGTVKRQIEQVSSGAIMAGINVTKLKSIMVHLPPLELQEQFADFVTQIDKSKSTIQKSLEKLEILKKALLQKYFG